MLVIFSAGVFLHAADLSDLRYEINGDAVTITDGDIAATGTLVIPGAIEGQSVTRIGGNAFWNCPSLTSITIPEGVSPASGSRPSIGYTKTLCSELLLNFPRARHRSS